MAGSQQAGDVDLGGTRSDDVAIDVTASDSSTVSVWSTSPRKLSSRGTFPFSNTEDRRLAAPKVVSPKTFADLFAH